MQRDTKGAHPKRARFHGSLIDANTSFPNEQWDKLPNVIIIFITETDVLGYGLPIYHICSIISENTQWFKEGREIIYVNASIQEDTALGRLMHDMFCTDPSEMHYEFLRKRVSYYKESKGGKQEMCEIWEEIKNKGKLEGLREGEAIGRQQGIIVSIKYNVPLNVDTIRRRHPIRWTNKKGTDSLIVDTEKRVF